MATLCRRSSIDACGATLKFRLSRRSARTSSTGRRVAGTLSCPAAQVPPDGDRPSITTHATCCSPGARFPAPRPTHSRSIASGCCGPRQARCSARSRRTGQSSSPSTGLTTPAHYTIWQRPLPGTLARRARRSPKAPRDGKPHCVRRAPSPSWMRFTEFENDAHDAEPSTIRELGHATWAGEVRLRGWVYQKRSSGKVRFLVLRDGSGYCQCVAFVKDVTPEVFELCDQLTQESSLVVTGTVRKDDRAPRRATSFPSRGSRWCDLDLRSRPLPDPAEGARRRVPARQPPPVAALRAPARDPARPRRGREGLPRFLLRARFRPHRLADLHAGGLRRHDDPLRDRLLRERRPT